MNIEHSVPSAKTSARDIVKEIVKTRHRIRLDEMAAILRAIRVEYGPDSLANSYIDKSFDGSFSQPWLVWCQMVRGSTIINLDTRGSLRDGFIRYDQPGSMHPLQHSEICFVSESCAKRYETRNYLRRHTDRLLIIKDEMREVWVPPGLQMRLAKSGLKSPFRLPATNAMAIEVKLLERNDVEESLIESIDEQIYRIVLESK